MPCPIDSGNRISENLADFPEVRVEEPCGGIAFARTARETRACADRSAHFTVSRLLGSNCYRPWEVFRFSDSIHRGKIGQMEQQFCWEVSYNLYVLHVGA